MMAKTPSLSASMRVSRNSPRRKRSSKRMLDPKIIRPSAVVFVSEIPRKRGGNSENWNERPDFVDDGNDRVHHSDGAVDDRCDEPNPDEDGGPGLPAPIQQAGAEEEHGQYDQAGNDEHQNVQCSAFRSNGVIVAEGAAHWSSCISSRASPLRRAILSPLVVRSSANDRNWVMERPFTDFRVRADHAVRSVSLRRSLDLRQRLHSRPGRPDRKRHSSHMRVEPFDHRLGMGWKIVVAVPAPGRPLNPDILSMTGRL